MAEIRLWLCGIYIPQYACSSRQGTQLKSTVTFTLSVPGFPSNGNQNMVRDILGCEFALGESHSVVATVVAGVWGLKSSGKTAIFKN